MALHNTSWFLAHFTVQWWSAEHSTAAPSIQSLWDPDTVPAGSRQSVEGWAGDFIGQAWKECTSLLPTLHWPRFNPTAVPHPESEAGTCGLVVCAQKEKANSWWLTSRLCYKPKKKKRGAVVGGGERLVLYCTKPLTELFHTDTLLNAFAKVSGRAASSLKRSLWDSWDSKPSAHNRLLGTPVLGCIREEIKPCPFNPSHSSS